MILSEKNILCNFGYERIDKMILDSLKEAFSIDGYKFSVFSLIEGSVSVDEDNVDKYKVNPLAMFVYAPAQKMIDLTNLFKYDAIDRVVDNADIHEISEYCDKKFEHKEDKDIKKMVFEYTVENPFLRYEIGDYISTHLN